MSLLMHMLTHPNTGELFTFQLRNYSKVTSVQVMRCDKDNSFPSAYIEDFPHGNYTLENGRKLWDALISQGFETQG